MLQRLKQPSTWAGILGIVLLAVTKGELSANDVTAVATCLGLVAVNA